MSQKRFQEISDLLLIFSLFFIANASAFFFVLWLSPKFVALEFVLWVVLTMISFWYLKKDDNLTNFIDFFKKNWFILPFLAFSGLSILWSVYWEISLARWLMLLFTIIAGGYIGLKYDLKNLVKLLSIFGIFILVFSALLVFFVPRVGVMNYYIIQGAWRGIYWHKNHMGFIATFFGVLFLINLIYTLQSKEKQNLILLWGPLYLFSLFFVYQTDSVAAYITMIFLHGVIFLALLLLKFGKKLHRKHYLIFLAIVIIASIVLFSNLDFVFGIFNRSTSLTGRIPMWTFLFKNYLSRKPLIGYGFNAFWYIESHQVAVQQAAGYPDPIIIADNGFIDILINTGFVGLFLFLIFYFGLWWRSIAFASKAKDIIGVFPVILMSYTLVANITWSLIFENEGFFMLLMISVLFYVTSQIPINRQT